NGTEEPFLYLVRCEVAKFDRVQVILTETAHRPPGQKCPPLIRLGTAPNCFGMQVQVKVGTLARLQKPPLIPLRDVMMDVGLLPGHAVPTFSQFYQSGTKII